MLGTCSLWNFPFQSRADLHLIDPRPIGITVHSITIGMRSSSTYNAHHQRTLDHSGEKANPRSAQWARRPSP